MDANLTEFYEDEPAHIQVLRFYLWLGMILAMGWVVFGVRAGQLVTEGTLYPWHGLGVLLPFDLPRMAGLVWLVAAGLRAVIDERRHYYGGDQAASFQSMLFVLGAIIGCGLAAWIGAWEHHLGTGLLVLAIVVCGVMNTRETVDRDPGMIWECALLTAAGTGVWLGFVHGLAYGLLTAAVMLICPRPQPRSEREMLEAVHG